MRQEKYNIAQQLIIDKDWIERSIKSNQYLDVINLFQIAHQTIGSQHDHYLDNWESAYEFYTSVTYYNLQQTKNLWKAILLHRVKETKEESPEHLEVMFGYANFCDRTNDPETYESLKSKIEKHWPIAFGDYKAATKIEKKENAKTPPAPSNSFPTTKEETSIVSIVEQMPRFPGCEAFEGDNSEKKACSDKRLLRFIYTRIKYPSSAMDNAIEGMSVVSFVVTEYGTIIDFKILRDPGAFCGEESLRVMKLMNELPRRWTPGEQRGKKVRVKYNLPVRFKLN